MSDFALFEQALAQFESTQFFDDDEEYDEDNICDHTDLVNENGVTNCLDCGEQIHKNITHEKEWRFYGSSDNKELQILTEFKCVNQKIRILIKMWKIWVLAKL